MHKAISKLAEFEKKLHHKRCNIDYYLNTDISGCFHGANHLISTLHPKVKVSNHVNVIFGDAI